MKHKNYNDNILSQDHFLFTERPYLMRSSLNEAEVTLVIVKISVIFCSDIIPGIISCKCQS